MERTNREDKDKINKTNNDDSAISRLMATCVESYIPWVDHVDAMFKSDSDDIFLGEISRYRSEACANLICLVRLLPHQKKIASHTVSQLIRGKKRNLIATRNVPFVDEQRVDLRMSI